MGFFSSFGKALSGGFSSLFSSGGSLEDFSSVGGHANHLFDSLDPGNIFHSGHAEREASAQWQLEYDLANKNFEQQKNAFEYQQFLNETQMERENDAVQRRVADLKAAGLSPTLAAGSPASATPVRAGTAPQYIAPGDYKAQVAMFKEQQKKDYLQLATTMLGNIADVSRTKAETELINAQKGHQDIINKYEATMLERKIEQIELNNVAQNLANNFSRLSNSAKLEEMKYGIIKLKKDIDIAKLDEKIKTNENLNWIYQHLKSKYEASLAGYRSDLAQKERDTFDKRLDNLDADTLLKLYALNYARDRGLPISGSSSLFGSIHDAASGLWHFFHPEE